jgi:hypothetical protein
MGWDKSGQLHHLRIALIEKPRREERALGKEPFSNLISTVLVQPPSASYPFPSFVITLRDKYSSEFHLLNRRCLTNATAIACL